MSRFIWSLLAVFAASSATVACVGDDPVLSASPTSPRESSGETTPAGEQAGCVVACADPSTLQLCDGTKAKCRFECASDGTPHCTGIVPSGSALTSSMLTVAGVTAHTFSAASTRLDTETGAIENLRAPNADPLVLEVKDGIGFQLVAIDGDHRVAIWSFDELTVADGALLHFTSANAAAFVVAGTASIVGVIDLRGYNDEGVLCGPTGTGAIAAGPGGARGSINLALAGGPGAGGLPSGKPYYQGFGPSGGGYGGLGGIGGAGQDGGVAGTAGASYGAPTLVPLLGGSAGAGIGSAAGGSGGGAFHLLAGTKVVIGDGPSRGGINAGGCSGARGSMGGAGGAGGSGGAILLETPALELRANGVLAANGASGAGATVFGVHGGLDNQQAWAPAEASQSYGRAGYGGAGSYYPGSAGYKVPAAGTYGGGAGGGSVGRIRINNRTGTFTVPAGAIVSPSLANGNGTSPTTVGTLTVD